MQSDILKKIDVLVEMAGSSLNIDTLQAELNEIEKESSRLKEELALLTNNGTEEKYFKASEKQVDENIKVSLEAKIKKQEKSLQSLSNQIHEVTLEESEAHDMIEALKREIQSCKDYITVLNERIPTILDATSLDNYKNILIEENDKLEKLISSLNDKENGYAKILEKLNYLNLAREEIEAKLDSYKERLTETKASLVNPSAYIDEDLKRIDSERIDSIKAKLLDLDKRRLEIITDPVMIALDAKELIIDDDRTSALSKVKELVTLVKAKPYMDIPSGSELNSILQEELENASNKRDEFAALIDSKDYSGVDVSVITSRIDYLNNEIANLENKINSLKEEVKSIDANDFAMLIEKLKESVNVSYDMEQSIHEYEEIINNEEDKTPKRRAVLNAAFQKKQKDLEIINKVIENYKYDQKELIKQAHEYEEKEIPKYENIVSRLKEEIDLLNKFLLTASKTKDVLAIETDKKKLKEYDDIVKAIKHRQKYSETPSEIFDEIEIYLGTIDDEATEENSEASSEPTLNYDYNLENIDLNEMDLNEELNLEENNDLNLAEEPKSDLETLENKEVMGELPEIVEEENESERLKVIAMEPIEEVEKVEDQENPFIIADYKDDDYIDVDSLFDSDGVL